MNLQPRRTKALLAAAGLLAALAALVGVRLASSAAAAPTELLISEYVEGSGNNKALEIYNGTGVPITLTDAYDVQLFANGSATATATIPLVGTLASGDVFVLARSSAAAAILAQADQTTTNFLWNGNDALALRHAGAIVDVVGQIGVDPGVEWGSPDAGTADNTLRRKGTVQAGDADGSNPFDPAVEWDGFPIDTFDGLGAHSLTPGGGGGGGGGAPTAVADSALVEEDGGPITIPVLANDSDPDGDSLSISALTDPEHGTAGASGSEVVYVPEVDFAGVDSFSYTISDGNGGTAQATVTVTVEAVNDDPDVEDDTATALEDGQVTIPVLANDEDADGDTLTVSGVEDGTHGTAEASADGTAVVYVPDPDFNGTDAFEVTVADGAGGLESGEVTVTVIAVDDPPLARPDDVLAVAGSSVLVDVLANDAPGPLNESDQALALVSVATPSHGTAVLGTGGEAGKVRYTPAAAFTGSDAFDYVVSDGALTATGTVRVTVRAAPMASLCSLEATILGTQRDDVLTGTPGDDVIRARRGNDVIDGNGGNDIVCGGPGSDRITTADGIDRIAAGSGADTVSSGGGSDRVRGGFGRDDISTGAGGDSVAAGGGDDTVEAGEGQNAVKGGSGDDTLRSGAGPDLLDGGAGTDSCDAGGGRNRVLRCE